MSRPYFVEVVFLATHGRSQFLIASYIRDHPSSATVAAGRNALPGVNYFERPLKIIVAGLCAETRPLRFGASAVKNSSAAAFAASTEIVESPLARRKNGGFDGSVCAVGSRGRRAEACACC